MREPADTSGGMVTSPYYDAAGIVLYLGDCVDLLSEGVGVDADLVLTDPPYGVSERTTRFSNGRSSAAKCNDFAPVRGDDRPFSPKHLLDYKRLVLFGANYYAGELPPSPSWIVWDKLDGLSTPKRVIGFNDNADVEMAWTNLGGPARLIPHRWMGMLKGSERQDRRCHPTQKPIALLRGIIEWRTEPGDLVLDPYAGSGSTLLAAAECGRRAIGIEIDEGYCETIVRRLTEQREAA